MATQMATCAFPSNQTEINTLFSSMNYKCINMMIANGLMFEEIMDGCIKCDVMNYPIEEIDFPKSCFRADFENQKSKYQQQIQACIDIFKVLIDKVDTSCFKNVYEWEFNRCLDYLIMNDFYDMDDSDICADITQYGIAFDKSNLLQHIVDKNASYVFSEEDVTEILKNQAFECFRVLYQSKNEHIPSFIPECMVKHDNGLSLIFNEISEEDASVLFSIDFKKLIYENFHHFAEEDEVDMSIFNDVISDDDDDDD
jgi:hypothetical protein